MPRRPVSPSTAVQSPFTFNLPVTLLMSYWGTQYAGTTTSLSANYLRVYYMAPDGHMVSQRCALNAGSMTIAAEITHFSRYILGGDESGL